MVATVALDPSLFADSGIGSSKDMVEDLTEDNFQFYIPASFYDLLQDTTQEGGLPYQGDQHTLDFFASRSSFSSLLENTDLILSLDIARFDAAEYFTEEMEEIYERFYRSLPAPESHDEYSSPYAPRGFRLADILFEEFLFGISMSPILTRIKKTVNRLKNGADYNLEIDEGYLEKVKSEIQQTTSENRDALLDEWERLENRSRDRHNQDGDEPVRRIAVLREIVKTYPDTNYLSYFLKVTSPPAGAFIGSSVAGPIGSTVGMSAGGIVGHYFADP